MVETVKTEKFNAGSGYAQEKMLIVRGIEKFEDLVCPHCGSAKIKGVNSLCSGTAKNIAESLRLIDCEDCDKGFFWPEKYYRSYEKQEKERKRLLIEKEIDELIAKEDAAEEAYARREAAKPKPIMIPFDIYDYIIISRRLAGDSLTSIAETLSSQYGHNISYQAVQHRIQKIIRFETKLPSPQSTTHRMEAPPPHLLSHEELLFIIILFQKDSSRPPHTTLVKIRKKWWPRIGIAARSDDGLI